MTSAQRAVRLFQDLHGSDPEILVSAPGRVNIIGEHTDYNDGFVLPAAIDLRLTIALRPHDTPTVELVSEAFDEPTTFGLHDTAVRRGWGSYVQGMGRALEEAGFDLAGWRGCLASDIPVGAGLSSSAAIEMAAARAFAAVAGLAWDPVAMARAGQRCENAWVGVRSGVMDQIACAAGRSGHALLLDCRSIALTAIPIMAGVRLVVIDTGTRRDLATSAYNDRRHECEAAARLLGVSALRDVSVSDLDAADLPSLLRSRVRHVVNENARTRAAAAALRQGDVEALGELVDASHRSLREDFAVSSPALDAVVEAARAAPGCHGARLTGAGFAGCALAIVAADSTGAFSATLDATAWDVSGLDPTVYVCTAADGASAHDFPAPPVMPGPLS